MGYARTVAGVPQLERLALQDTVIDHPDSPTHGRMWGGFAYRGPLLPQYGSRARELSLRHYWHHDYNTLFRSAIAGLIKRIQSTPYEITSPRGDEDMWQSILMQADFGDWDRFLSKLIIDYSRHDQGAFIELIAPGDPRQAPLGPIVGLAVLDSLRCYPTGIPDYPVIYYSLKGKMHLLHRSRVIQFVDTPDSEEGLAGYGDCALSRCVAPVNREILIGRYIEQFLDDKPPPGVVVFGNIKEDGIAVAMDRMNNESSRDDGGQWGRVARLYSLDADTKPSVDFFSFTKAPEGFDLEKYKTLDVREIALGIGLDVQDMWELTGQGLGTGTQSQILAEKSRGKAIGRILKTLERVINRAFPEDVEFTWKFQDVQADTERAQQAQTVAGAVQIVSAILTPDEQRRVLANSNELFADVLIDENGEMRRLNDADPKGPEQGRIVLEDVQNAEVEDPPAFAPPEREAVPLTFGGKEFGATASQFAGKFANFIIDNSLNEGEQAILRTLLREQLRVGGVKAYRDGLKDGGVEPTEVPPEDQAAAVNQWLAAQNAYVDKFVKELSIQGISEGEAGYRADLWVNKSLRTIYYAGVADADNKLVYPWLLGQTEKHCQTCLANTGQKHTMKEWIKAGMFPGSSALECHGYKCDCRFGDPVKGRSQGTLPNAKPTLGDRLLGWLRNIFRGGR